MIKRKWQKAAENEQLKILDEEISKGKGENKDLNDQLNQKRKIEIILTEKIESLEQKVHCQQTLIKILCDYKSLSFKMIDVKGFKEKVIKRPEPHDEVFKKAHNVQGFMNNNLSHWQDKYDILSANGDKNWQKGRRKAISEKHGCTVKMCEWIKIGGGRVHDGDRYAFSDGTYVQER